MPRNKKIHAYLTLITDKEINPRSDSNCNPKIIELSRNQVVILGRASDDAVDVILSARDKDREIISRKHAEISCSYTYECIVKDLSNNERYLEKS